jgi:hypothetical protein
MAKRAKKRSKIVAKKINSKKIPTPIKIISILFYISAILSILSGILMVISGIAGTAIMAVLGVDKIIELIPGLDVTKVIIGELFLVTIIFGGIMALVIGILEYFIGRDLKKGKKWAYIVAVILVLLGLIKVIFALIINPLSAILGLIIYGVFGYYLLVNKKVKKFFS